MKIHIVEMIWYLKLARKPFYDYCKLEIFFSNGADNICHFQDLIFINLGGWGEVDIQLARSICKTLEF